jgi:hypothetical protein
MRNPSNINQKQRCSICVHSQRRAIDQLLASGGASQRAIANRFQIGRNALARHHERHVLQAVRDQILRREERECGTLADLWERRLHETFESARRGLTRAEADDERWTNAIGFLSQMNKAVETGMTMTGQIEGGRGVANVTVVEQILVLPRPEPRPTPRIFEVTENKEPE